jgi:hypothetical protein
MSIGSPEDTAKRDDQAAPPTPQAADPPAAEGDFRGPYGYGRAAHKSDPASSYIFELAQPQPWTAEKPEDK